jgi:hypothetical protein
MLLQKHPLLAWPLFIFFLALAFYLYPEDYVRIHMQYLFWLTVLSPYHYWLYSLWSLSCLLVLYLLAGSLACFPYAPSTLPVPILLYSEPLTLLSVHDIVTPCPYRVLGWWLSPHYPYHSLGLWLSPPFILTLLPVSDSVPSLPAYLCTTTYGLVCAQVPYIYKPCVPWLYSLTWIYLVLPGYLVHNLLSLISLYLWLTCFALTFGHRIFNLSEAFIVILDNLGYSYRRLQDSTRALPHQPTYPKWLDCDLWPAPVLQAVRDYPSKIAPRSSH